MCESRAVYSRELPLPLASIYFQFTSQHEESDYSRLKINFILKGHSPPATGRSEQ
jgi:hypothetical protein